MIRKEGEKRRMEWEEKEKNSVRRGGDEGGEKRRKGRAEE